MDYNRLIKLYDVNYSTLVFSAGLNELDLIKLKLPFKTEVKDIAEGNSKLYSNRIEDGLSCKVCKFYDEPVVGGIPNSTLF